MGPDITVGLKTSSPRLSDAEDHMILRLSVLTYNALSLTCDGQTDRQTDRHKDGQMDTSHVAM